MGVPLVMRIMLRIAYCGYCTYVARGFTRAASPCACVGCVGWCARGARQTESDSCYRLLSDVIIQVYQNAEIAVGHHDDDGTVGAIQRENEIFVSRCHEQRKREWSESCDCDNSLRIDEVHSTTKSQPKILFLMRKET